MDETNREQLLVEIRQLIEAIREKEACIEALQKELNDARWFLGEERSARSYLEGQLLEARGCAHASQEEFQKLKRRYEESQWFLGEERSRLVQREDALRASQEKVRVLELQVEQLRLKP